MLRGREKRLSIGFTTKRSNERIKPLITKVFIPPRIVTPGRNSAIKARDTAFIIVFLRSPFIPLKIASVFF